MKAQAILFTNYTDEDFSHTWDSVEYKFPAKQAMMLEEGLAYHFARHLAIRELNKAEKSHQKHLIDAEIKKILAVEDKVVAEDETQLESKMMNLDKMDKKELSKVAKEKGIKVDKRKGEDKLRKEIEEFEGLKEDNK